MKIFEKVLIVKLFTVGLLAIFILTSFSGNYEAGKFKENRKKRINVQVGDFTARAIPDNRRYSGNFEFVAVVLHVDNKNDDNVKFVIRNEFLNTIIWESGATKIEKNWHPLQGTYMASVNKVNHADLTLNTRYVARVEYYGNIAEDSAYFNFKIEERTKTWSNKRYKRKVIAFYNNDWTYNTEIYLTNLEN